MQKFLWAFIGLGLLLISGFAVLVLSHGRSVYQASGGFMMVAAMVTAAGIDIRLRSPEIETNAR